ncbi:MAG: aldehyde dehydrogenase family protein [Pseudomonadota bacterium]
MNGSTTWSSLAASTKNKNGEVFARIPASGGIDAQRAIDAAGKAFPAWAAMGARARQALFLKAADILERRVDDAVHILAAEIRAPRKTRSVP